MLFSSPIFFVFFSIYFLAHLIIPARFRLYLIIVGSTVFYAWWEIGYVWLPYVLMVAAYSGGQWVSCAKDRNARKQRLIFSSVALFLPLFIYKYADFMCIDVIGKLIHVNCKLFDVGLPLGISFLTFTLVAYLIDVYRQRFPSDKPMSVVLAYVLFFPHLIAGPILHPRELIPQLERPRPVRYGQALMPIAIFSIGLLKKLVFADQVGALVNSVYLQTTAPSGPEALLAVVGFAVQLFCDFSGYTDMAIGLALLIGVRLPNNFERPYTALSISGLWRRWHITLTRFLMAYIYTPLSLWAIHLPFYGKYSALVRVVLGVLVPINVTFIISGVWHGAGWHFICFGIVTGIAMTIDSLWRWARMPQLYKPLAWALTMGAFLISLVFFKSPTVDKAIAILTAVVSGDWSSWATVISINSFSLFLIAIFALTHRFDDHRLIKLTLRKLRPEVAFAAIVFCWLLAITISHGSSENFVYFDF